MRESEVRRTLITNRARALRKSMSDAEVLLWTRLRGRGPEVPTFRRQHPFGTIILDFYCPSAALAVEVDGRTHWDDDARERDAARDIWLARQGIEVMRIPASRVYRALDEVTDAVLLRADERKRSHLPREAAGGGPPADPDASRG
jgi:very-short-patch-repair endonuclease